MWTLNDALWIMARLEPELAKVDAHCALAGSVMYRGSSDKDLDIIVYPHDKIDGEPWELGPVKEVLQEFFKTDRIVDCGGASQSRDDKAVSWCKTPKGKRVDFFFLS